MADDQPAPPPPAADSDDDDILRRRVVDADLFGDSDDDDAGPPPQPPAAAPAPAAPLSMKEKLAALAARKKEEAVAAAAVAGDEEDGEAAPPSSDKQKRKKKKTRATASPPPNAPAAPAAAASDDDDPSASEDEDAAIAPRTADDDAFIDDDGAERRDDRDDEEEDVSRSPTPGDAGMEESNEFDAMFEARGGKRGWRGGAGATAADADAVKSFIARMEWASEADTAAAAAGKPAVERLRLLPTVRSTLGAARLGGLALDAGVLSVLRAWIAPEGGRLPPAGLRAGVLDVLASLPVDAGDDARRAQLKASGVGSVVLFYAKLPSEAASVKRAARALVEKWAAPVHASMAEAPSREAREAREAAALAARAAAAAVDAARAAPAAAAGAPDAPVRRRALPPRAPRLDYVRRPDHGDVPSAMAAAAAAAAVAGGKRAGAGVEGRLRAMAKRAKAGAPRAARPSVEGRGMD